MSYPNIDLKDIAVWAQGEWVFVKLVPQPNKTESGLALPLGDFERGTIISIGPEAIRHMGFPGDELDDQVGEYIGMDVLFLRKCGVPINTQTAEPAKFIHCKEVLAVLEPENT